MILTEGKKENKTKQAIELPLIESRGEKKTSKQLL